MHLDTTMQFKVIYLVILKNVKKLIKGLLQHDLFLKLITKYALTDFLKNSF